MSVMHGHQCDKEINMYKRITHNIVEEHFDHPVASQIKSSLDKAKSKRIRAMIPTTQVFDPTLFMQDVNSYFSNYATKLNQLISSTSLGTDAMISSFESMFTDVNTLGDLTKHFYDSEFGERINVVMRSYPITTLMMIQSAIPGHDVNGLKLKLKSIGDDLKSALFQFNNNLVAATMPDFTNTLGEAITEAVLARRNNDLTKFTEMTNIIGSTFSQLGSIIANQIVTKFPNRFQPVPASTSQGWMCPTPTPTPTPTATM